MIESLYSLPTLSGLSHVNKALEDIAAEAEVAVVASGVSGTGGEAVLCL